ncbi:MAG: flagellar motor switch protein FliN [Candidatus Marinimicrobia bacterium]|nr:flagellar motor switch protein FliN [Candidatus Neomarinimicrobiota bacterium]
MKIEQIMAEFPSSFESLITPIKESLNQLCGHSLEIDHQFIDGNDIDKLLEKEDLPRVFIIFVGKTDQEWSHWFSVPPQLVANIFAWMIGDEAGGALEEEHLEGIGEALNQIFGQLQTFLEVQDQAIDFEDLKIAKIEELEELSDENQDSEVVAINYKVAIADDSYSVNHYYWTENPKVEEKQEAPKAAEEQVSDEPQVQVNPVEFEDFSSGNNDSQGPRNLDMLMDVQLEAVVELGRKTIPIKDVLKLGKGSIIELDKTAGESLEIFINGRKLAEGEVVVVDEQFGIRITHLLEPKERIKSLQ